MLARHHLTAYRWLALDAAKTGLTPALSKVRFFESIARSILGQRAAACASLAAASRLGNGAYAAQVANRWSEFASSFSDLVTRGITREAAVVRSIVLRSPGQAAGGRWKGILLIKFTATFSYYYWNVDIKRLTNDYHVFLEPSWMGYCDPDILFWGLAESAVFVESSEERDRRFLRELDSNLVPVEFGSSDWVDDRVFTPISELCEKKAFDVTYVANRGPYKRSHLFFSAVASAAKSFPEIRAAFVCSSWGGGQDDIRDLVAHYKVEPYVEILESLSQRQINEVLNRSKVCVLLSRKEGSNRSLFEAMFANTPVLLLKENVGVNKDYINSSTGRVVAERDLVPAMLSMILDYATFRPREWAMSNISPHATRRKLVQAIRSQFPAEPIGEEDVRLKVNGPELRYYDEQQSGEQRELIEALLREYELNAANADSNKQAARAL